MRELLKQGLPELRSGDKPSVPVHPFHPQCGPSLPIRSRWSRGSPDNGASSHSVMRDNLSDAVGDRLVVEPRLLKSRVLRTPRKLQ